MFGGARSQIRTRLRDISPVIRAKIRKSGAKASVSGDLFNQLRDLQEFAGGSRFSKQARNRLKTGDEQVLNWLGLGY
jgi:hypothetical protein